MLSVCYARAANGHGQEYVAPEKDLHGKECRATESLPLAPAVEGDVKRSCKEERCVSGREAVPCVDQIMAIGIAAHSICDGHADGEKVGPRLPERDPDKCVVHRGERNGF
eukprot:Mycagemm_TRINITY_DN10322_c6_g7::TRINITY_DN10322_c6_g7_i1::g.586::m.586 type:complete len:110 gc:universal TRINITY_DN10322_c6_g7_i1:374-703(+)